MGGASGSQQQFVVGDGGPVDELYTPRNAVNRRGALAGNQADPMLLVPVARIEDDVVVRLLAREHRGQEDAAVVGMRLSADDGNVEAVGSARYELLDRPHSRHSVAHDDKPRATEGVAAHARLRRALARDSAHALREGSCADNTTT
jgi:hypothetical protein